MDLQKNIRERCHVNKNDEGDSFVGVKADTDDAVIYFPIGYQLPPNDDDLRADINNLFYVLAAFMKEDKLIEESKFAAPRTVDFPMHADGKDSGHIPGWCREKNYANSSVLRVRSI